MGGRRPRLPRPVADRTWLRPTALTPSGGSRQDPASRSSWSRFASSMPPRPLTSPSPNASPTPTSSTCRGATRTSSRLCTRGRRCGQRCGAGPRARGRPRGRQRGRDGARGVDLDAGWRCTGPRGRPGARGHGPCDAATWDQAVARYGAVVPPHSSVAIGLAERTGVIVPASVGEPWQVVGQGEARWLSATARAAGEPPVVAADGETIDP